MMKYLLDTNVLSEAMKTEPNQSVLARLERHRNEIVTASLVWHELKYGCYRLPRSRKRKIVKLFLDKVFGPNMLILPYDERAAEWHAKERARLSLKGRTPSFVDGQIAAIAKVNGLVLVTRNTTDFKSFSELVIENWHQSR